MKNCLAVPIFNWLRQFQLSAAHHNPSH